MANRFSNIGKAAAMVPDDSTNVETITLPNTWASMLNPLLCLHEEGNPEGKRFAREELIKMARAADLWVAKVVQS